MSGHYPATGITRLGAAGGVETSLAAQPDLSALAGAALAELAEAIGAEVGALWGAGEEGGPLTLLAVRGTPESDRKLQFTVDKETKRSYIDLSDLVKRGGVSFKSHY